jgi:ABC-2 type transport system ATP-binding protein
MAARDEADPPLAGEATTDASVGDPQDDADDAASTGESTAPGNDGTESPLLAQFIDVSKNYGAHPALGPITLDLSRGCIGLLGPNGAGKTTFLRLLMGILPPSAGTVKVLGEEVRAGAIELRRRIGYAPEGDALFPGLSGVEAVAYAGRLVGMPKTDALQRAHQVLDYVELGEARYRLVEKYSTGMRQRLKLAQALVHDPELLVLDEPTEGVDPEARNDLLDLIAELQREHGLQLILSTHLLHDVERLATHALVLNRGRVMAHGPLSELKAARRAGLRVRVRGDATAFQERLSAQGIQNAPSGSSVVVQMDDPRAVLQHAKAAGVVVRHVAPLELSLNEAFEQAVGGEPDA